MKIRKADIRTTEESTETIEVRDLRDKTHPEYITADGSALAEHIHRAIAQNGIRVHDCSVYNYAREAVENRSKLSFPAHMRQLAGNAKGILKYRYRHGKSSFRRYENHTYESLDLLKTNGVFKADGAIYRMVKGTSRLELVNAISDLCKDLDSPRVLEAGCGSGLNMYMLNCRDNRLQVSGFEYTNARLASALVNLWHSGMRDNLFLADVCNLYLADNSYDVVYSNHVLEQLGQERATRALEEMWRVCRYGLVICEPSVHGANLYEKWRMRTLGYCEDLVSVVKSFPDAEVLAYKEDDIRYYPNTSHHLIVRKHS